MNSRRWAACCLVIVVLWWAGMGIAIDAQVPAGELRIQELKVQVLRNPQIGRALYDAIEQLFKRFVAHGICFFDPSNILVQWTGPETFRLRIADFEPSCRALLPGLSRINFYVRCKVRRRATRYLRRLDAILNGARHAPPVPSLQRVSILRRLALDSGLMM